MEIRAGGLSPTLFIGQVWSQSLAKHRAVYVSFILEAFAQKVLNSSNLWGASKALMWTKASSITVAKLIIEQKHPLTDEIRKQHTNVTIYGF